MAKISHPNDDPDVLLHRLRRLLESSSDSIRMITPHGHEHAFAAAERVMALSPDNRRLVLAILSELNDLLVRLVQQQDEIRSQIDMAQRQVSAVFAYVQTGSLPGAKRLNH